MKQLNIITLKLGLIILAAAGIVSACSMNCGCCDPEKAPYTETAACCIVTAPSDLFIPVLSSAGETDHGTQDACNSCSCNTSPIKESSAVTSGYVTLKINQSAISVSKHIYITQYRYTVQPSITSLNTLTAASRPLRI